MSMSSRDAEVPNLGNLHSQMSLNTTRSASPTAFARRRYIEMLQSDECGKLFPDEPSFGCEPSRKTHFVKQFSFRTQLYWDIRMYMRRPSEDYLYNHSTLGDDNTRIVAPSILIESFDHEPFLRAFRDCMNISRQSSF
jgi:hypothetical protein